MHTELRELEEYFEVGLVQMKQTCTALFRKMEKTLPLSHRLMREKKADWIGGWIGFCLAHGILMELCENHGQDDTLSAPAAAIIEEHIDGCADNEGLIREEEI